MQTRGRLEGRCGDGSCLSARHKFLIEPRRDGPLVNAYQQLTQGARSNVDIRALEVQQRAEIAAQLRAGRAAGWRTSS
jgi:hypothetical protein